MIHHVYANDVNVGDRLAALGIRAAVGATSWATHYCDAGQVGAAMEALVHVPRDELVVVGGGGLIMDYFLPLWEGLARLNCRIILWGVGVCDHKERSSLAGLEIAKEVAGRSERCVVRDTRTAEFLGTGTVVPCPALLVGVRRCPCARGVLVVEHPGLVGPVTMAEIWRRVSQFATATQRSAKRVDHMLRTDAGQYRHVDVVVSTRLHGCVLAVAAGAKVVAVSNDWKIDAFMEAAGLGAWVVPVGRLSEALGAVEAQPSAAEFVDRAIQRHLEIGRCVSTR